MTITSFLFWSKLITNGVLQFRVWGLDALLSSLQRTFSGIWFESLWIIPLGLWFVGHCAIMVRSWSVWGRISACAGLGGGVAYTKHWGALLLVSPYCCRWTLNKPTNPLGLTHKSFSSRQQRDYRRNRLIYFCEFTCTECSPQALASA